MNETFYPRLDEHIFRTHLENGLTVIVVPRPGFAKKSAYFVTRYGSIHTHFTLDGVEYTTPDGVAHYLEHKMFDMPEGDVTQEFAALGANPNAFTSYDMTAYYFSCTEHFNESLELLLKFVSTPYFTPESVEKERGIIAQEILMYEDSPDSKVFEDLMMGMYRHHPLRCPISGSVESIAQITPEILYTCHRAFYAPANMVLCVVGDVDPEAVAEAARQILPREKTSIAQAILGPDEELTCPTPAFCREMDVAMPMFQIGFKCPAGLTGEEFAHWELVAELAAEALFGESSGLYLRLYEEGLIDSSFGGGVETIDGAALLTCSGDSDDPQAVRDAVLSEAVRLAREPVGPEEFARMKKSAMGRRVKDLDSFESTCFRLCAYHMENYDYFRFPDAFSQIHPEELSEFIANNVTPERCAISVVKPRTN